jgi:hypothetical protein
VSAHDPFDVEVQQPADLQLVQNGPAGERRTVQAAMARSDRFAELNDLVENR